MDRGAWWAAGHGVARVRQTERLSTAQQPNRLNFTLIFLLSILFLKAEIEKCFFIISI